MLVLGDQLLHSGVLGELLLIEAQSFVIFKLDASLHLYHHCVEIVPINCVMLFFLIARVILDQLVLVVILVVTMVVQKLEVVDSDRVSFHQRVDSVLVWVLRVTGVDVDQLGPKLENFRLKV